MNCPHCDYLLFNLTRPTCPECGNSFVVTDYRFDPGAVSFHCPHCDQEHYGNDEFGLPSPRQFQCVQCDQPIEVRQMRVEPKHPSAQGVLGDLSPWDRRRKLGIARAWWDSFKLIMVRPTAFYRRHAGRSTKEVWLFAIIAMYLGLLPPLYMLALFALGGIGAYGPVLPYSVPWAGFALMPHNILSITAFLIYPLLKPLIWGCIWTCTIHIGLVTVTRERQPIVRTLQVVMFGLTPLVFQHVFGCLTYLVAFAWTYILVRAGVREVHRIGNWQASLVVLWPVSVLLGGYLVLAYAIASSRGF